MNPIAELGDEILRLQAELGLSNPNHQARGMTEQELATCALLKNISSDSELHNLYRWRNGTTSNAPMGRLWFVPGHYLISAQDALSENEYMVANLPDWKATWYPLMRSGSADYHFFDTANVVSGKIPVFYSDPEFPPGLWQVYDNLECMFTSVLECYKQKSYYVGSDGFLEFDARSETEICKRINPASDHWQRSDLY